VPLLCDGPGAPDGTVASGPGATVWAADADQLDILLTDKA
jgi:hypothetical protein